MKTENVTMRSVMGTSIDGAVYVRRTGQPSAPILSIAEQLGTDPISKLAKAIDNLAESLKHLQPYFSDREFQDAVKQAALGMEARQGGDAETYRLLQEATETAAPSQSDDSPVANGEAPKPHTENTTHDR